MKYYFNTINTNDKYGTVPQWAVAENMEAIMPLKDLWKLSSRPQQKHKCLHNVRRGISVALINLAREISSEDNFTVVSQ